MFTRRVLQQSLVSLAAIATASGAAPALSAAPPDPASAPPVQVDDVVLQPVDSDGDHLTGRLEVRFPGHRLSRTLVQWVLALASRDAQRNPYGFYNLRVSGEVRRDDDRPVDRFDYRFDLPAADDDAAPLALVFGRDLRPGAYQLALEVEDLESGRRFRARDTVKVPELAPAPRPAAAPVEVAAPAATPEPPGPARAAATGPSIVLLRPRDPILLGRRRFAALPDGPGIERVTFLLDGQPVLTKTRPPFSVELDLGEEGEVRTLAVEAWGAGGETPLARDEMVLNTGRERFALRLVEPRPGTGDAAGVRARPALDVPAGARLERIDYYLGDRRVAHVDDAPFDRAVCIPPAPGSVAVRAVARLSDGRTAEDAVVLDDSAQLDRMKVHLVELYTAAVNRRGRSVGGLAPGDFRVLEDGDPQRVTRFERVDGLPLHVALVLDVSGSMRHDIDQVGEAARHFLTTALRPGDASAIVLFDRAPRVAVPFTDDLPRLQNALTNLQAGGGTALREGLLFALRQFDDVAGQRVVLLFSDGAEHSDAVGSQEVLDYARRSGVTVYTVGMRIPSEARAARLLLQGLGDDTGGRAFFVDRPDQVAAAYDAIDADMRSRYLLAYQSSHPDGDGFRQVRIEVARAGVEARTVRGYYP